MACAGDCLLQEAASHLRQRFNIDIEVILTTISFLALYGFDHELYRLGEGVLTSRLLPTFASFSHNSAS